ncbi:MAG: arginyltransferase, partial [Thermaurantiacus sp.]
RGSERMDYKRRFTPLEALSARGWYRLPAWRAAENREERRIRVAGAAR